MADEKCTEVNNVPNDSEIEEFVKRVEELGDKLNIHYMLLVEGETHYHGNIERICQKRAPEGANNGVPRYSIFYDVLKNISGMEEVTFESIYPIKAVIDTFDLGEEKYPRISITSAAIPGAKVTIAFWTEDDVCVEIFNGDGSGSSHWFKLADHIIECIHIMSIGGTLAYDTLKYLAEHSNRAKLGGTANGKD